MKEAEKFSTEWTSHKGSGQGGQQTLTVLLPIGKDRHEKFSFGVRVVEPWNKLDGETRNCEANKAFKNKLKRCER